jgi:hypothetical protein
MEAVLAMTSLLLVVSAVIHV